MSDQRVPVLIKSAGRVHAIGVVVGGDAAPVNVAQRSIASAIEAALAHADDVQRSDAGPVQKQQRVQQALAPAVKALQEGAQKIMVVREQLAKRMGEPVIAPWSATTPYFEVNVDSLLAQRFASLPPMERAKQLAAIREDANEHEHMLRALVRTPKALTGLSSAEVEGLGVTALRTTRPDDYKMMSAEAEQLGIAEKATVIAGQILTDAGLSRAELMTYAPAAAQIAALQSVRFADEHPHPPRFASLDTAA